MQNALEKIFDRPAKPKTILLAVAPPKTGERTMLGVENMLASIAASEPFSLKLAGNAQGVTLMARCTQGSVVKQRIVAHYPQADIHEVHPHEDPMLLQEGEQAWSTTLRLQGPEFLPLRTFHDRDLLDQGSDPIIALIGSLSNLDAGERVSARLHLQSLVAAPQRTRPRQTKTRTKPTSLHLPHQTTPNGRIRTRSTRRCRTETLHLSGCGEVKSSIDSPISTPDTRRAPATKATTPSRPMSTWSDSSMSSRFAAAPTREKHLPRPRQLDDLSQEASASMRASHEPSIPDDLHSHLAPPRPIIA